MLYAVLCYDDEAAVAARTSEADAAAMNRLETVHPGGRRTSAPGSG